MAPATASPFAGQITHNAGTILRLEPEDDEDEDERRREAEERARREIEAGLQQQLNAVMGEGLPGEGELPGPDDVGNRLSNSSGPVRVALERALAEGADLGTSLILRQLAGIGMTFNYNLVHSQALQWARDYSYELITGINETSRQAVETALARWIETGAPLDELRRMLEPTFGSVRASRIAVTEATRSYAEGTIRSYQAAGFNEGRPTIEIPRHVNCRCWYGLEILGDGTAYWTYFSVDAGECTMEPPCRSFHLQRVGLAKRGG
ncbi:MAG: hypothetical protein DCC55_11425 [Chloroflexi bacterium]|nr:MAG: hypothetical protein DCC55_11425 [Chloroflexota bacterium]